MVAAKPLFSDFFQLMRAYGIPLSMQYLIEFQTGLDKGLVRNLDELFLFLRLTVVKKAEQMDAFERAFALYFFDIDIPDVAEGDPALLNTSQFQTWLKQAIAKNEITGPIWNMNQADLIKKFWQTLHEQLEKHDGGNRWIGTGGSSPFGHSGMPQPGVRMHGPGGNGSAIKAIGERNYIDYTSSHLLKGTNIRQALTALKQLKPSGAHTELDISATIRATAQNGGEIELVFQRDLKDKISVILMIDNGGMSMLPHVDLTRLLFDKLKDRFKELKTYYFHNTIYDQVFADPQHRVRIPLTKLLQTSPETRVIIMGDASMGPQELVAPFGSLYFESENQFPSIYWLEKLNQRFPHLVWLTPILKEYWEHSAWTLTAIAEICHMEDLSLNGIKKAVAYLND
jgi:uncharacterized protein